VRILRRLSPAVLVAASLLGATSLRAQEDGTISVPNVYRVQFENEWVRLVRVTVPAFARIPEHTHPPGLMMHVYLNDAEPLTFIHARSAAGTILRPAVKARSYRIGRTHAETHSILNIGNGATDWLRLEIKTEGTSSTPSRITAPPLGVATAAVVEVTHAQIRVTRITVAPRESFELAPGANEATLLIAMTEGVAVDGSSLLRVGDHRFVNGGRRAVIKPQAFSPVQVLQVEFLTRPAGVSPPR
jgi:hypothetical protein